MVQALIEMICDGNRQCGFGHIRRSLALAKTLQQRGHRVRLTLLSPHEFPNRGDWPHDAGAVDVWLLDLPYPGDHWVAKARYAGQPVLTLDYSGQLAPDQNVAIFDHGVLPIHVPQKVGLSYAIIRDEVRALAPATTGRGVLVCLGGGDLNGIGMSIAHRLAALGEQVTLIEGPFVPERAIADTLPFTVLRTPEDLPARMAACRWAVTNGGTTMMEMMCLGKPVHVLPQTEAEYRFALHVLNLGGVMGVGQETLVALGTHPRIDTIASHAARLVDGQGLLRIASEVESLLS
ncbi:MAG: hypothetical protein HQM04_11645 [Magnetococcales bacterium]|nr:hypothetical protein [Magnetococcales bacterium]MBF0115678.1 hypothetical protein [Magnetococcales bacterium]